MTSTTTPRTPRTARTARTARTGTTTAAPSDQTTERVRDEAAERARMQTVSPETPIGPAERTVETPRASTGHLVADVAADVSTLFRQEIALAKAELREEAAKAGRGAGMFAGAGGAGGLALLFVLLAAMFGLAEVMALGWAALIVSALLLAVAGVLALRGRRTMKGVHAGPTQTVETLREDVQWAQSRRKT